MSNNMLKKEIEELKTILNSYKTIETHIIDLDIDQKKYDSLKEHYENEPNKIGVIICI